MRLHIYLPQTIQINIWKNFAKIVTNQFQIIPLTNKYESYVEENLQL